MNVQSVAPVSPQFTLPEGQRALSGLSEGDLVRAQVVDAADGRVTLRLPGGETLTASQRSSVPLESGDQVLLQVGAQSGEGAAPLELVSVNGQPLKAGVPLSEFSLLRIQVPPTRENLAIAQALTEIGADIRPETFSRMQELTARFPQLPAEQALLFAASDLPLNAQTVEAFQQWLANPAQVPELSALASQLPAESPAEAAVLAQAAQAMNDVSAALAQPAAPVGGSSATQNPDALPQGLSPALSSLLEQSGVWTDLANSLPQMQPGEARGRILQLLTDLPPETTAAERSTLLQALQCLASGGRAAPEQPLTQTLQAAPLPGATPDAVPQPPAGPPSLAQAFAGLFAALQALPTEEPGAALQQAAEGLAPRIRAFVDSLAAHASQTSQQTRAAVSLGQTLTTQIQMGSELGNLICMQLPLELRDGRQQEAALYVLKRGGRGSRVDGSNVTVAVCLDTQNLGMVDSLIQVERNELSLQFRVDSEPVRQFFQNNLPRAAALCLPPQYRFCGASVRLREAPMTPANAGKTLLSAFGRKARPGVDISI